MTMNIIGSHGNVTDIDYRGPIFDGRARLAANEGVRAAERDLAGKAVNMITDRLNVVLKTQTPVYRLQIEAKEMPNGWRVHDSGIVYGPWLEGTSRRNQTTRFKGYATFRRIAQQLDKRAVGIVARTVQKYVRAMR
jgi:hypothetical protein